MKKTLKPRRNDKKDELLLSFLKFFSPQKMQSDCDWSGQCKRTTEEASDVEEEAILRVFLKKNVTVGEQLKKNLKWQLTLM